MSRFPQITAGNCCSVQRVSPVAEAKRITDFFVLLGEDQSLLTEFDRDPKSLLQASGLDDNAITTVLAGDSDAVRAAIEDEVARDPSRRRLVVAPRMMIFMKPDEPEPEEEPKEEPKPEQEPAKPEEPEPEQEPTPEQVAGG